VVYIFKKNCKTFSTGTFYFLLFLIYTMRTLLLLGVRYGLNILKNCIKGWLLLFFLKVFNKVGGFTPFFIVNLIKILKNACRKYPKTCRKYPKTCRKYPKTCRKYPKTCRKYPKTCRGFLTLFLILSLVLFWFLFKTFL